MELEFYTLDVFTAERFAGNPLAVVMAADDLSTAQMQRVAREFNLSETVFVMAPENEAHSARVRIFTPMAEMPFAGHPTVGTAALLAELRAAETGSDSPALMTLEENIGLVRVGVRIVTGRATFAECDAPKLPVEVGGVASPDSLAAALGLIPGEIGFANHVPTRFDSGPVFTFVPVVSGQAIGKAAASLDHWADAFGEGYGDGAFLYTTETVHATSHFHARMFAPTHGILEDPATGSAVVGLAGVVAKFDEDRDGHHNRMVEQGIEMGRASFIAMSSDMTGGKLVNVRIGGDVVRVSHGRVNVG